jgi:hypothetical protein
MKRIKLVLTVAAVMAATLVFAAPAMADVEQEAESGDVDQSFEVSGDGNNSNQSAGIQGVTNTGNTQSALQVNGLNDDFDNEDFFFDDDDNLFFLFDDGFDNGDFEFEDVGAEIDLSPESSFSSNQSVDQSATASD